MGLATIINMIVFACVPVWGNSAVLTAWVLWWIDVALSVACCMYMPFIMYVSNFAISGDKPTLSIAACPFMIRISPP